MYVYFSETYKKHLHKAIKRCSNAGWVDQEAKFSLHTTYSRWNWKKIIQCVPYNCKPWYSKCVCVDWNTSANDWWCAIQKQQIKNLNKGPIIKMDTRHTCEGRKGKNSSLHVPGCWCLPLHLMGGPSLGPRVKKQLWARTWRKGNVEKFFPSRVGRMHAY